MCAVDDRMGRVTDDVPSGTRADLAAEDPYKGLREGAVGQLLDEGVCSHP